VPLAFSDSRVPTIGTAKSNSGAYEVGFSNKVDRRHVTLDAVRHAIETEDKAALMGFADPVKVPVRRLRRFRCRERRHAAAGHWMGRQAADELREAATHVVTAIFARRDSRSGCSAFVPKNGWSALRLRRMRNRSW
jgi:hypothetical protein